MHHTLPIQHNRYINQTSSLPTGVIISNQIYNTLPHYIPQVPAKIQAVQPHEVQKVMSSAPANSTVRKWEDIVSHPATLAQTVLKPQESTVTFRGVPASGKKLSNRELIAKADLILAKSPKKPDHQQIASSRPPLHVQTFTSPVKSNLGVPLSHPSSVPARMSENVHHMFVSPQRERGITEVVHTIPTVFQSPPAHRFVHEDFKMTVPTSHVPMSHFSSPNYDAERLDSVVNKIIRNSPFMMTSPSRNEPIYTQPVIQTTIRQHPEVILAAPPLHREPAVYTQHAVPTTIRQHPEVILAAPPLHGRPFHQSQNSGAQPPLSDFSEIQRDFFQLKMDSLKPPTAKDLMTPTPFLPGYGDNWKASGFAPELLRDKEESHFEDENRLESDRESRDDSYSNNEVRSEQPKQNRRNNPTKPEPVRKLFNIAGPSEVRLEQPQQNRHNNPTQPEPTAKVFMIGEQSGGNKIGRNPYKRKVSQNREEKLVPVNKVREVSVEDETEVMIPEPYRASEANYLSERTRKTSSEYILPERKEEVRKSLAIEEEIEKRKETERTIGQTERRSSFLSPKREEFLSPKASEPVIRKPEESGNTKRKERDAAYSRKVEIAVQLKPEEVGKRKLPKVMSKTEKFFG